MMRCLYQGGAGRLFVDERGCCMIKGHDVLPLRFFIDGIPTTETWIPMRVYASVYLAHTWGGVLKKAV